MAPRILMGFGAAMLLALSVPAAAQLSATTQFMKAVKERDAQKAIALLSEPGSVVINSKNADTGEGALHLLTRERDLTWIGYLLGKGAKPDIQDRNGMTPLAVAAQIGWVQGADRLIRGGAKVDMPNKNGETPLILAVLNHDLAMVKFLLSKGADPKRADNLSGQSALDHALKDGRASAIVKELETPRTTAKVQGPAL